MSGQSSELADPLPIFGELRPRNRFPREIRQPDKTVAPLSARWQIRPGWYVLGESRLFQRIDSSNRAGFVFSRKEKTGAEMSEEFVDPELETIYYTFLQRAAALDDGILDIQRADVTIVDNIDFSVVYPLVTPRDPISMSPLDNPHDYFSVASLRNLQRYKNTAGFHYCYSPFLILELFDQIEHRKEYYEAIRDSKNSDELRANILKRLSHIPTKSTDVDAALERIVASHATTALAKNVGEFRSLIRDEVVKSLFEFVDEQRFYSVLKSDDDFAALSESIDLFRRRSSSNDPADRELHRTIDIYMVLSTSKLARYDHKRVYYVGQEKLRRIFPEPKKYTRDILTPHLVLKALSEVPSDRILKTEALQNMQHRRDELRDLAIKLLSFRRDSKIPVAVARSLRNVNSAMNEFVFGEAQMTKREEYRDMIRGIAERPRDVKDIFAAASDDASNAQVIVKQVADSLRNQSFRELAGLKPNERVRQLFAKLED